MAEQQYKAGLIGCGRIGYGFDTDPKRTGVWTHAGAYRESSLYEFSGACDGEEAKRDECSRLFGVTPYEKVEDLLAVGLDVVSVAVPEHCHYDVLNEVLDHKCCPKVIWMEKPFIGNHRQAEELCQKASARGSHIHINYLRRWCDMFRLLKNYDGVQLVTVCYARGVLNTASHFIDLVIGLYGSPYDVKVLRENAFYMLYPDFTAQFIMLEPSYNICHTDIICKDHRFAIPPIPTVVYRQNSVESTQYSEHRDLSEADAVECVFDPMTEQATVIADCLGKGDFSVLNDGLDTLKVLDKVLS